MKHRDNAFSLPIVIPYQPPTQLAYFITFSHFGAVLCLLTVNLMMWIKTLFIAFILVNYIHFILNYLSSRQSANKTILLLNRENVWSMISPNKSKQNLILTAEGFVHRFLVVIRLKTVQGDKLSFVLTNENVEKNTLRRLRVRLRHDHR
jgi:hypothetical protein